MRTILFKAMSIEDDANFAHWVTGDLQTIYGEVSIANNNGVFKVYPETVCQYIGVEHPEHGKIFEGDVFKSNCDIFVIEFKTEEVGSCGCCFDSFVGVGFKGRCLKSKYDNYFTMGMLDDDIEFVGNIHDNDFDIEKVEL